MSDSGSRAGLPCLRWDLLLGGSGFVGVGSGGCLGINVESFTGLYLQKGYWVRRRPVPNEHVACKIFCVCEFMKSTDSTHG